jgi:nicotinate-nucleotide adenylyltransferase
MKKTILYGGALNPPTNAHLKILNACIAYSRDTDADVWIMPSGPRPDKSISTKPDHRTSLIKALVNDSDEPHGVAIENFEMSRDGLTETYITHDYLTKTYPDRMFIWVFGSDSLLTMKEWGEGERLWRDLHMLVVSRPGFELEILPPNATPMPIETGELSSTLVRTRIARNEDVSDLVPASVYTAIRDVLKNESIA